MGCVYRRGGSLWAFYRLPDGSRSKSFATRLPVGQEGEARALVAELERQAASGEAPRPLPPGPLTVRAWGERWNRDRRARGILDWVNERAHLEFHLYPFLGDLQLAAVTKAQALDWVRAVPTHKTQQGGERLAPRTVHKIAATVRAMFKEAVKRDLLPATPCVWDAGDLPAREDRDATRAREGGFTAEQVGLLIGDPRVPEDRRALYALEFLTGMRTGEAAARRWRDWEPEFKGELGRLVAATAWNTRARIEKPTKTRTVKWIPVHPELARVLGAWKRGGWPRFHGRTPEPDDLIVPGEKGGPRNAGCSWRLWAHDLVELGLDHQRHYESRSTFRNLARAGGANLPDLDLITHPSPRAAKDLYNRTGMLWPLMCAAVRCVRVEPARGGEVAPALAAVQGLQSGAFRVTEGTQRGAATAQFHGRARESNPPAAPLSTTHRF